ncbi:hypothetical protein [Bacillus sp. 1P06AnD]|uniref:hypothetical protein n=1 Tax=Bacillus sp. 1P06AnD TaxID=3132208 RepID=UPI0039A02D8E
MTAKSIRFFALGILVAAGICGIVYLLGSDSGSAKSQPKVKAPSVEKMKENLNEEGYLVFTEDELQNKLATAKSEAKAEAEKANSKQPDSNKADGSEKVVYRTILTVTSGMTSIDVGEALAKAHIISNGKTFSDAVERKRLSKSLRPGTFEIRSDMTIEQIVGLIFRGN